MRKISQKMSIWRLQEDHYIPLEAPSSISSFMNPEVYKFKTTLDFSVKEKEVYHVLSQ